MSLPLPGFKSVLRVLLIAVSVVLLLSFAMNLGLSRSGFHPGAGARIAFDPTREVDYDTTYHSLATEFEQVLRGRDIQAASGRNLFEEYRPVEDFFLLVDIRSEPLALIYKGRIERPDGAFIAQVNWGDRTYFVRQGEAIDGWQIIRAAPGALTIQHKDGETITLPYLEVTYRKERMAVVYDFRAQKEDELRAGDALEGYTVTEISEQSVTFSGKDQFTLLKEGHASPRGAY